MNEAVTRHDLRIIGTSVSAGGIFQDVKVTGECSFGGDVECVKFSQTGEVKLEGSLRMQRLKITGECEVTGRIDGMSLRGQGELTATGGLRIDEIRLTGAIKTGGDCEAEELQLTGAIEAGGLLNAGKLELFMIGASRAANVGGGTISIRRSRTGALLMPGQGRRMAFNARLIEGDQIELQNTQAELVRGGRVVIGSGCEIDTVEYSESLEVHKSAVVRNQVQIKR